MSGFSKFLASLGGRKFVTAILGVVAVVLTAKFGFSEQTTQTVIQYIGGIVGAFVIGQGVADGLSGGKTSTVANAVAESKDLG